jgi:hypothetical protein
MRWWSGFGRQWEPDAALLLDLVPVGTRGQLSTGTLISVFSIVIA